MEYFSEHYFKESFRQSRGLGILFIAASVLACAAVPFVNLIDWANGNSTYPSLLVVSDYSCGLPVVCMIFPVLLIMKLFSFLFKRGASDFYHALPFKRQCIYISNLAVCLVWYILGLVVSLSTVTLIYTLNKSVYFKPSFILMNFTTLLIAMLNISGGVLIAVSLAGRKSRGYTVSAVMLLVPRIIYLIGIEAVSGKTTILERSSVKYFSSRYNMPFALMFGDGLYFGNMDIPYSFVPGKIVSLLVALIYISAGLYLFTVRKSEKAENAVADEKLNCFLHITYSGIFFIVATALLFESGTAGESFILPLAVGIGVFIFYAFFAERKLKKVLKSLIRLVYIGLLCGLFYFILSAVSDSLLSKEIKGDDIKSVKEYYVDEYRTVYNYSGILISNQQYEDREIINLIAKAYAYTCSAADELYFSGREMTVEITYKDGSSNIRRLLFEEDDYKRIRELMDAYPSTKEAYVSIPEDCYILNMKKKENNEKLWECFKNEYMKLPANKRMMVCDGPDGNASGYSSSYGFDEEDVSDMTPVRLAYSGYYGTEVYSGEFYVYPGLMPNTAELFYELGREENLDVFRKLKNAAEGESSADGLYSFRCNEIDCGGMDFRYINLNLTADDGNVSSELLFNLMADMPDGSVENIYYDNEFYLDGEQSRELLDCFNFEKKPASGEKGVNVYVSLFGDNGLFSNNTVGSLYVTADKQRLEAFFRDILDL